MRHYIFNFIAALMAAGIGLGVYGCARESRAIEVIEKNGAAISKAMPDVTVLVPHAGGREKSFGDEQLLAILPFVSHVDYFGGISVSGSSVSDVSIAALKNIPELQHLDVSNTNVTVAGLLDLQTLPKLRRIIVGSGQLSADDMERLRRALPEAEIVILENRGEGMVETPDDDEHLADFIQCMK